MSSYTNTVPKEKSLNDIGDILEQEFIITIAIVNSSGIEEFLTQDWDFL